ncbi:MAG: (Fe-S)-binding protein [Actinomycetota bacterium]
MTATGSGAPAPIGTELPAGVRFVGERLGDAAWPLPDAPTEADISTCVACGLCLPHCPTYRLTADETASPRGRIAAMRAVSDGAATVDDTFGRFMDLCLVCRACEDVCPSHVPFGRMMERARAQIEPRRPAGARFLRRLGLDVVLPRPWLVATATTLQPLARPFLPRRVRGLVPRRVRRGARVAPVTHPAPDVEPRGTVALLTGCVQDRWFREVNRATARVLARNGWRVVVPSGQACCGALAAHNGRLDTARKLARRNLEAFADVEHVVVNAAGCGAHLQGYGELIEGAALPAEDVMAFLHREGLAVQPPHGTGADRVAYHDACHALRVLKLHAQPRALLRSIPGLEVVEIPNGDRCCGAAGLYNVLEPELSGRLSAEKAGAIASTGATTIASANPGCTMQIAAGLRALGVEANVVHPIQLLDRAYAEPAPT